MKPKHPIVILDYVEDYIKRAIQALNHGNAVVFHGDQGAGVTTLLHETVDFWEQDSKKSALFMTAIEETDHLKLLQHLGRKILRDKMPQAGSQHCASTLIDLMTASLTDAQIGLLVVDRAEAAQGAFLDAVLTMAADCGNLGVLLGMRTPPQGELLPTFSHTCVAFSGHLRPVTPGAAAVLVSQMIPNGGKLFFEKILAGDSVANEAANELVKKTAGNARKFIQFCQYLADLEHVEFTAKNIGDLWESATGFTPRFG